MFVVENESLYILTSMGLCIYVVHVFFLIGAVDLNISNMPLGPNALYNISPFFFCQRIIPNPFVCVT